MNSAMVPTSHLNIISPLYASQTPPPRRVVYRHRRLLDKAGLRRRPVPFPTFSRLMFNSMMAVEQKSKVRVIMNLSAPAGASLNDAIDELALEKVTMSSAKAFGYSVIDCGPGARMWKWDLVDAYKNIPASPADFRLQAFSWLGMGFVETQKVFGDSSSVAAFDRLGNTLASLASAISDLPPHLIRRTLDDTPIVTPPPLFPRSCLRFSLSRRLRLGRRPPRPSLPRPRQGFRGLHGGHGPRRPFPHHHAHLVAS